MLIDNIDKVFKSIVAHNLGYNEKSIPHSDEFIRQMESLFGFSKPEVEVMISILKESHKILTLEISKEDKLKDIDKIVGYVDADLVTVGKLKGLYFRYLEDSYENDTGKKKTAGQIIKELIPRLQYINNTPLGKLLNKTMMIDEFERLLEKDYKSFTEEYKQDNLIVQIDINKDILQEMRNKKDTADDSESAEDLAVGKKKSINKQRAVDSPEYGDFVEHSNKKSIQKLLSIYGVDFFFRVNLRKKKFQYLKEVVDSGVLDRKKDLILLKDLLKKIKSNAIFDKELHEYHEDILILDRKLSKAITFSKK